MLITRTSILSNHTTTRDILLTEENILHFSQLRQRTDNTWYHPTLLIQQAFPNLSPNDREFIMTGITPEEWSNLFTPDT